MVVDILYDTDLSTEYDGNGDVATVSDEDGIVQAVTTDVLEQLDGGGPPLTPDGIEDQRSRIERIVRANTFTEPPISVTVQAIDHDDERITYEIQTNRISVALSRGD